jgi:hypothetical protein
MTQSQTNRPFKYGARDRKEFIVQDSEVSIITLRDSDGNVIYEGRAKIGEPTTDNKWQIRKIDYDSNSSVSRMTWPQDSNGAATGDFIYIWEGASTSATITGVTQANPGVVTVSDVSNISDGDIIQITDVVGMTELNFKIYKVANVNGGANTFELNDVDDNNINTSGFTAYSSGGTVFNGNVLQYTYS